MANVCNPSLALNMENQGKINKLFIYTTLFISLYLCHFFILLLIFKNFIKYNFLNLFPRYIMTYV